jgi:membrane protein DedA with SNARE-associated domain
VVIGAGAIGIPLRSILIFGSLGSTVGALVGYAIGRFGAMPLILKFGKYIFIKPHHIHKAEAFARKYGVPGVLIGRMLPIIPFKVFSIASGLTCVPPVPFVVCTLLGVVPRIYLLALYGSFVIKYTKPVLLATCVALGVFIIFKLIWKRAPRTIHTKRGPYV